MNERRCALAAKPIVSLCPFQIYKYHARMSSPAAHFGRSNISIQEFPSDERKPEKNGVKCDSCRLRFRFNQTTYRNRHARANTLAADQLYSSLLSVDALKLSKPHSVCEDCKQSSEKRVDGLGFLSRLGEMCDNKVCSVPALVCLGADSVDKHRREKGACRCVRKRDASREPRAALCWGRISVSVLTSRSKTTASGSICKAG